MIFSRKSWFSLGVGILCLGLVPGLVYAQQSFSGISKRLQGMETRILSELNVVMRVIDDGQYDPLTKNQKVPPTKASLRGYLNTVHPHSFGHIPTGCSATTEVLSWNGTAWVCNEETDPGVREFAKTDLPVCASTHGYSSSNHKAKSGGYNNTFNCIMLPTPLKGDKPDHQWSGTSVRFESDYGSWGPYTNLKGPKGETGVCP